MKKKVFQQEPIDFAKCSTCSEQCFSLARLNLIRQSWVVLRETIVQLGKSFRGGATTPSILTALAIFGGKRQLPPLMPPKINHWRQKIAVDNFTNICVNNASLLNSYIFFKYEHQRDYDFAHVYFT